ncbi:sensor histidine kinase [Ornithinimicrobium sp. Y1694]|uniref:sensor histidine kinase n=1 Tax=Ornithinimicrobium sp. Y1694 TaxID=3418590 RepID=UPI003CEDBFD0
MSRTTVMIRRLVLVQHVLFGLLVVVGVVRGLPTAAHPALLVGSAVALVAWYVVGAVLARRVDLGPGLRAGRGVRRGGWWLLVLVALWLVTVVASPDMVWVAFSLWMLAGHLLPLAPAIVVGVVVLGVVIGRGGHAEDWSTAAIVGPFIGGVFALALSRGLQVILADGLEREWLHTELAEAQRQAGVMAERTRLSREIHDTLAQGFSSILLLARAGVATDDPQAWARLLGQIETSAHDGLDEARRVVGALAPAPLESGLADALRRIVERFESESGVCGVVRVEGDVADLPPPLEVALLRTAQSALANVRQHAGASQVVLTLAEAEELVRLDVVDDGRGFDPAGVNLSARESDLRHGGYGLRASRARLRELGGGLEVESEPGAGTAIGAYLPRAHSTTAAGGGAR